MYNLSDRGLRKMADRNGCRLEKSADGWNVIDSVTGSLVSYELTATQVASLWA